jgi:uncharacterized protein YjbI with pentapeptide repeats
MKRLTILITMLMATSGWAYNESDLIKLKTIYACINCDLSGLDFTKVYTKVWLSTANLTGANLTGANLTGGNLTVANFSGANLTGANLSGANLTGANLSGANLTGADLSEADFSKVNLREANLSNADFSKAKSMSRTVLDDAKYCNTTMLWGVLNDGC